MYTLTLHEAPLESPMSLPDVEDFPSRLQETPGFSCINLYKSVGELPGSAGSRGSSLEDFNLCGTNKFVTSFKRTWIFFAWMRF